MTTILLILGLVALFVLGLLSPKLAGRFQRKVDHDAAIVKRKSNRFWDPITAWIKGSIDFIQKTIHKSADLGKKTNRKL